jgi:uncharacterized protein (TIGR00159 family)
MNLPLPTLLLQIRFADVVDVAVISILVYVLLMWLRKQATRTVVLAIVLLTALYAAAHFFRMYLTSWIFQTGLTAILVALVLIFQEDIRRLFERFAAMDLTPGRRRNAAASNSVDELVQSVFAMAREHVGALIVLRGKEPLDRHMRGGITLEGRISMPLICTIFFPKTPGHDGALIIDGDRVDRFKVQLPLSANPSLLRNRGTRHAAALGLSERSDALVIVVSEERGTVSIAEKGIIEAVDAVSALKDRVTEFYSRKSPSSAPNAGASPLRRNLGARLLAVGIAVTLWILFASSVGRVSRTYTMPIEFRNLPAQWVIDNTRQTEAHVVLAGSERAFDFDASTLALPLDVSQLHEGAQEVPVDARGIALPKGVVVSRVTPRTVHVEAHQMVEQDVAVKADVRGRIPDGLELGEVRVAPPSVKLLMRPSIRQSVSVVRTEPLGLDNLRQTTTVRAKLALPDSTQLAPHEAENVRVTIEVRDKSRRR